jgi:hypothetical protein
MSLIIVQEEDNFLKQIIANIVPPTRGLKIDKTGPGGTVAKRFSVSFFSL